MRGYVGLFLALSCVGCAKAQAGHFAEDAYYEQRFPVRGHYAERTGRQVPPGEWLLLNYQMKDGLPAQPKVTGDIEYRFDTDGDGELDATESVKAFSLRYQHARTGAELWLFFEPLSFEKANLNLQVLAENHVEASAGSGTIATSIGSGVSVAATKKVATRVLDGRETTLDGMPAYVVTYEVANVDQLQLSPESRWRRARLVFVRTPYRWVVTKGINSHLAEWPVIAVVGYEADPRVFDAQLPDFSRFAGNIDFMSDGELLQARAADVLKCKALRAGTVDVAIGPDGGARSVRINGTKESICAAEALNLVHFAPTGEARGIRAQVSAAPYRVVLNAPPPELAAPVVAPAPEPAAPPLEPEPVAPTDGVAEAATSPAATPPAEPAKETVRAPATTQ